MLKTERFMSRNYLTITPEMAVEELARLFLREHVSGAMVVDKKGKLLGVVTEGDLIAKEKNLHLPTVVSIFDAVVYLDSSDHFKEELKRMVATRVEEIYSRDPVTVGPDSTMSDVATIMTDKHVHYIPVLKNGNVEGVVSRLEILRALSENNFTQ